MMRDIHTVFIFDIIVMVMFIIVDNWVGRLHLLLYSLKTGTKSV